ncbi:MULTISPECIES: alpha/beta fold hydrolase [unclassified Streptomyces]|uniref:alpha/beta fold hydrolase n=1 Tax=unclassified Streptomyces TaxID=2593676 RepID=UPI00382E8F87
MTIWLDLLGAETKYYEGKYRTRVLEAGTGDLLILLHGGTGHAETYARNILRLSEHFRVIAPDLLWHGFSSCPEFDPQDYPLRFVDQMIDLMDVLGVEKASIEGESLGGWVALATALRHPDRVHKIILNTTAGVAYRTDLDMSPEDMKLFVQRSTASVAEATLESVRARLEWLMAAEHVTDELVRTRYDILQRPQTRESLQKVVRHGLGLGEGANHRFPESAVADVTVPTLVFWTENNPGHGPEVGEHLASLIPGARFYCMKGAGHWPMWEKPEEHDTAIREFLLHDEAAR